MNYKTRIGLLLLAAVAIISSVTLAPGVLALPSYASTTGASCGTCHINPGGGGTLTTAGEVYKQTGSLPAPATPTTPVTPTTPTTTPTNYYQDNHHDDDYDDDDGYYNMNVGEDYEEHDED